MPCGQFGSGAAFGGYDLCLLTILLPDAPGLPRQRSRPH